MPRVSQSERSFARARGLAEVLLIVGLVLLIIWVVKPAGDANLDLALRILVAAILLGSAWLHGDSRERLGLRVDNLGPALTHLGPFSIIAAALLAVVGRFFHSIHPSENEAYQFAYYFAWASAQQYALQSVVLLRLQDSGIGRGAPFVAAAFFSIVHAPNPGLMTLTLLGGCLWCSTFYRHPNLLAVTLSHAILAVIAAQTLPPSVIAGYRIGPAYSATISAIGR